MSTLGAPANEVQGTLSATFTRGTDTNIALQSGEGAAFPNSPNVVRITYDVHWCLVVYSSVSTDALVMGAATDYALANNVSAGDDAYTWPVGSRVELVSAADYISQLQSEDGQWTKDRDADGYVLSGAQAVIVKTVIPAGKTVIVPSGQFMQILLPVEHYTNGIQVDGVLQVDGGFLLIGI